MNAITVTTVTKDSPGAGQITVVGTYASATFAAPSQQTTVVEFPPNNSNWPRNVQVSNQAIFCKKTGANSVALYLDSFSLICKALEPTLSWPPRFSTQPSSVTIAAGANTTLTSVEDVTDELSGATFQWARSTDGGLTFTNITGATTPNDGCTYSNFTTAALTITAAVLAMTGFVYKVTATNGSGSTASSLATLTVSGSAPSITGNPSNASCVHNSTAATFTVTATGSSLTYQWQVSINGSTGWTNTIDGSLGNPGDFSGSLTATLTVTPPTTAQTGYSFRAVVTNPSGSATSTVAVITIT